MISLLQTRSSRIALGLLLMVFGAIALTAPFLTGQWSLQLLAIYPFAIGMGSIYASFGQAENSRKFSSILSGMLAVAVALLLFVSPSLVASGILGLLLALLVLDGAVKIWQSAVGSRTDTWRLVLAMNGIANLILTLAGWWLWQRLGIEAAIGILVGGYTIASGWTLALSPPGTSERPADMLSEDAHPDPRIGLKPHPLFRTVRTQLLSGALAVRLAALRWLAICGTVLFLVHVMRMQSDQTWLGLISPVVATLGDVLMAVGIGAFLILPLRLLWRYLSRPVERFAWQLRFSGQDEQLQALPRWAVHSWTTGRYAMSATLRSARSSLQAAGLLAVRLGLPLSVLLVAVNPIWGFSWYFNTESWASAFYQKVTELRVDTWRARMTAAVARAYGGDNPALFAITPAGVESGDFRFLVIGDPGEGDGSQLSLTEQYIRMGREEDVKFLVISSDVIYPAGAMTDYERNFFLPNKGWTKPVYAIPGNHDWFDALEGFNANFLEPKAARAALAARAAADLHLTSTNERRITDLLGSAEELRSLYGIDAAKQRAPYFELQTDDFALIAIDTGIRRTIDPGQQAWLDGVLSRSSGKFTIAILGHPRYAAGVDTSLGDPVFTALYDRLEQAGVRVFMAGDTHAFEHYLPRTGGRSLDYFVNGGGGAYLSIGGALAWPGSPATSSWEFYPPPNPVIAKLDAETPTWKQPFWFWVRRFGAWPVSIETLSAMFDFNRAPFFQSFMEVRVERSRNRVVLALHGVNGPLHWNDLHMSSNTVPGTRPPDGLVEFTIDLRPQ